MLDREYTNDEIIEATALKSDEDKAYIICEIADSVPENSPLREAILALRLIIATA